MNDSITDWDKAYAISAAIDEAESYTIKWEKTAESFRMQHKNAKLELPYGNQKRQCLDLFLPATTPKGLAVFVHGGYWMSFDKSYWSHLAAGCVANGWACSLPSYRLAPEVRITEITLDAAHAITHLASLIEGPIRLAGHSAGGHLVTQMVTKSSPLCSSVKERIDTVLSISGLHDLHPLMNTKMNQTLHIDKEEADQQSPALLNCIDGVRVTAWVGGNELPEFMRQAKILSQAWPQAELNIDDGFHHFNVIEALAEKDSPITKAFLNYNK